jgi:hypothetical protein
MFLPVLPRIAMGKLDRGALSQLVNKSNVSCRQT